VIFDEENAVAPDVAWVSRERLPGAIGEDGKLRVAPDLAVEVLSPGNQNERRDRDAKLRLYSVRGVREYWIVDWRAKSIEVYRRESAALNRVATLYAEDELTSPLLPGFTVKVARLLPGQRTANVSQKEPGRPALFDSAWRYRGASLFGGNKDDGPFSNPPVISLPGIYPLFCWETSRQNQARLKITGCGRIREAPPELRPQLEMPIRAKSLTNCGNGLHFSAVLICGI
jgi:hypothetical protein